MRQKLKSKLLRNKPGPIPLSPSSLDRRRVQMGAAAGLSSAAMARSLDMPVRTFDRVFEIEIETGRASATMNMLAALYDLGMSGSAAACKAVLAHITKEPPQTANVVSPFDGLTERYHAQNGILADLKNQREN
jgi:hypothetical protein